MKALKTLVAIALSAGGIGTAVTLGLVANNSNEVQVAEATDTTRLYLDMSGFSDWYSASATFKVHVWNGSSDVYTVATKVSDAYWYADVDLSACTTTSCGWRFTRFSADGSTQWNQGGWNSWSSSSTNTYYQATGYTAGTWSQADQKSWTIVGASSGSWTSDSEDISISLTMRFNDEGLQFYNTSVSLITGSVFKIKNSDNNYYGYSSMSTNSLTSSYLSGSGTSNITVVTGGTFEVYMKPLSSNFWMQVSSETEATSFAQTFLDNTGTICSDGSTSDDHSSALAAIWNTVSGDSVDQLEELWNRLTTGAKSCFATGTANSTISDANARYVHIMSRYSATLNAFSGGPSYASQNILSITTNNNNEVAIIATITAIIAVSATGVFFMLRKKRKEQ